MILIFNVKKTREGKKSSLAQKITIYEIEFHFGVLRHIIEQNVGVKPPEQPHILSYI